MKLYFESENGIKTEIREVEGLGDGDLIIIQMHVCMHPADVEELEHYYRRKFGRKVIILDGKFGKVYRM